MRAVTSQIKLSSCQIPAIARSIGLSFAIVLTALGSASARQALTLYGEQIADATLFDAAKAEGTLTYYTVNFEDMERATLDQFKQETGINYEVVRLAGGRMYERIMTESGGGQLQADLVSLSEPILMKTLIDKGILASYKIPNWDAIPAALKHPDGMYYTENRYAKILGYNKTVIAPDKVPTSWADLLKPDFANLLGIQEANSGGISWTTALLQRTIDPNFWTKLGANRPKLYNGMTPIAEDVTRGEIGVGEMTFGLARAAMDSGAPVGVIFPKEGLPAAAILVGLTSVAKHPNAAKVYLNWIESKHGGTIITQNFGDWASNPAVASPDGSKYGVTLPAATSLWMANPAEAEAHKKDWLPQWDAAFRSAK